MVLATGIKLIPALKKNPLGYPLGLCLVALTIVCVNVFKMPLAFVLLGLGGLSTLWAARQLQQLKALEAQRPPHAENAENTDSTQSTQSTQSITKDHLDTTCHLDCPTFNSMIKLCDFNDDGAQKR
jgi:hypothetical protein